MSLAERIDSKELKQLALAAGSDSNIIETVVGALQSGTRRERQKAAQVIGFAAEANPEAFLPYVTVLVSALDYPEAQTRWEVLAVLTKLACFDGSFCDDALQGAEAALFDEDSGSVRLAGMQFMCKAGSLSEERSEKVWPLIDEAIQCYHGDHEFNDMLNALVAFSGGCISDEVKDQLAARMKFDAENGKGTLKRRAAQILENVSR